MRQASKQVLGLSAMLSAMLWPWAENQENSVLEHGPWTMSVCCGRTTPCKTIASLGGGEEGVVRLHLTGQGSQFGVGPWELAENEEK